MSPLLTAQAFLFPEDLVGVEDLSSDSSPPVAMLSALKIRAFVLNLGTAAGAAARRCPGFSAGEPHAVHLLESGPVSEGRSSLRLADGAETGAACVRPVDGTN